MKVANIQATLVDHMGSDLSVVNAARVSFHKESEWDNEELRILLIESLIDGGAYDVQDPGFLGSLADRDVKLINYLAKHKHFSPFNHTFLTFRVKAPIFVARQLVKHKFMPWNEVSRRYVDEEPEFYFPDTWRGRPENSKQGSSGVINSDQPTMNIDGRTQSLVRVLLQHYLELINLGIAPEQARMVLPQNTMTEWIWSGTLGAYCDMLRLRLDEHTQYESRLVAQQIKEQIAPLFPVSMNALLEN